MGPSSAMHRLPLTTSPQPSRPQQATCPLTSCDSCLCHQSHKDDTQEGQPQDQGVAGPHAVRKA